jgi:uncharacterized membrane protein
MKLQQIWIGVLVVGMGFMLSQCVHTPVPPKDPGTGTGWDTTGTDSTGNDTTVANTDLCDPDTVYFENDIAPLLAASCAVPGCHDVQTAEDGVILTGYNNIISTGDVRPSNPSGSDLYEVVTEMDPDKKMPPPSSGKSITPDQIEMIRKWIAQGAKSNGCDENAGGCDTVNMSFSADVFPIIQNKCLGCHSGTSPQGNVRLETHAQISNHAGSGKLLGAIDHQSGYTPMPYNRPKLDECTIAKIGSWINDGVQNN